MSTVDRLLRGSIDMHVHHGPDPRMERRYDALGLALDAQKAGMRAIVLKSHEYPTAPLAHIVSQIARDITVCGSLCLDWEVGGLNPAALKLSAEMGAKVVWMPTFSAASWRDVQREHGWEVSEGEGISVLDKKGGLLPIVGEIIDIVKEHDIALATGHLNFKECIALVEEARERGVTRIIATHASMTFSIEEQKRLADAGAVIEHCCILALPDIAWMDMPTLAETIKELGAERCLLSTDLGQAFSPPPPEGLKMTMSSMLEHGLSESEIELMVKTNPARLLGLS
ncbi:DUF6282 family protein [Chloroflexota bacterium]